MREVPELESNVSPNDKGTVVKDNDTDNKTDNELTTNWLRTENEWTTNGQQTDN